MRRFIACFCRTGAKKNRQARLAVFREFRVLRTYDSPLSIRQRLEMPKEIKVKLGGHGGSDVCREKQVTAFITSGMLDWQAIEPQNAGNPRVGDQNCMKRVWTMR
ncbi:hypothetical protein [Caballeronia arationis]|uniref:hypothetical protein n=1 Tax=Caballeronia arationis TaxID=1777142 RepID=UPI00135CB59F|nr:hypothetical protein [Caballeronia arationis]